MQHPLDLVDRAAVDRDAAEPGGDDGGPDVFPCVVHAERQHVCPGGHDLFGVLGAEVHDAFQNALFFFRPLRVVGQFQRLFEVFHADLCGGVGEFVVHPTPHADQGFPNGAEHLLGEQEGGGHEFGQIHAKRRGVNLGDDLPKEHQQKGDTHHMNQRAEPQRHRVARKQLFRQDCRDQDDGDVHQVVDDQDGAQQVARSIHVVGGTHEVQDFLGPGVVFLF